MNLFGIKFPSLRKETNLSSVKDRRSWLSVFESFPGAWQRNIKVDRDLVLTYPAVYTCVTLIAGDCSKLRVKLVEQNASTKIWSEVDSTAFSPVLRKPNSFQNRIQFWENWFMSKLTSGNTYVLKKKDSRGVVNALYVLDWQRVTPLVSDSGDVFYELQTDNIAGIKETLRVPASEIIHDRYNCLFHPLVGTSPVFAAGWTAMKGINIEKGAAHFFGNKSQPGGILVAPGHIEDATATELKNYWNENFTGENAGRVAVVGDGLKFESLAIKASDAQLIEQLKWTAEVIASVFHIPLYKVGVGNLPAGLNIQALNVEYYSQALQGLLEAAELCLDEGLGLVDVSGRTLGTEFDTDNLLRMDSATQMTVLKEARGVMKVDEMRRRLDLAPVEGGDAVYLQQQDYSLSALAKRDAQEDPFTTNSTTRSESVNRNDNTNRDGNEEDPDADNDNLEAESRAALVEIYKGLR